MLETYSVLIKRNAENKIISYFYPDFNFEHSCSETTRNLSEDITHTLAGHIQRISKEQSITFPRHLSYYEKTIQIGPKDHWQLCYIDVSSTIGRVEKYLPSFGVFSSITAALTMAIINFYTTKESIRSTSATGIGSTGAITSALMVVIMYYFSEANDISRRIGRKTDSFFSKKSRPETNSQDEELCNLRFSFKLFLTLMPIIATIFGSYSHYKQVINVIDSKEDSGISVETFKYLSIIMIIFSSYSKLIFQLSFLPPAYNKIDEYLPNVYNRCSRLFSRSQPATGDEEEVVVLIDTLDTDVVSSP